MRINPEHQRGISRECEIADKLRDSSPATGVIGMTA